MARIKAKRGFKRLLAPALVSQARAVAKGFIGNSNLTAPPVDPKALQAAADDLSTKYTDSLDGSKKAKEALRAARTPVINMLEDLANYAETACKDDMTIFLSSGFQAKASTRTPQVQPPAPKIKAVRQGPTGVALVDIEAVNGARGYVIEYGVIGNGGTPPAAWMNTPAVKSRPATRISGLTPGVNYAFQVRALGPEGYTDWSPSVTRIMI
jgi:hypothetical protein